MRDNRETSPEIILNQVRLKRHQNTLNIELGLSNKQSVTTSSQGAAGAGGTSSVGGSDFVLPEAGGGGGSGGGDLIPLCFTGSTIVDMFDHPTMFIRFIECGFYVDAPDEKGEIKKGRVIGLSQKLYDDIFQITFEGGRRTGTRPEHRYKSEGGEYVPVVNADHCLHRSKDGWERIKIVDKSLIRLDKSIIFYNLEVEKYASYIANGDWVSNKKIEG